MEFSVIEKVRQHPVLYDTSMKEYKDSRKRQEAWVEIGLRFNLNPEIGKIMWAKLRRRFANAINRRKKLVAQGVTTKNLPIWKFEKQMAFLLPFMEIREAQTLFEQPATAVPTEQQVSQGNGLTGAADQHSADVWNVRRIKEEEENDETQVKNQCYSVEANEDSGLQEEENTADYSRVRSPKNSDQTTQSEYLSQTFANLDETDLFFLSMSTVTKRLSRSEQTTIKLLLSSAVLQAELKELGLQSRQFGQFTSDPATSSNRAKAEHCSSPTATVVFSSNADLCNVNRMQEEESRLEKNRRRSRERQKKHRDKIRKALHREADSNEFVNESPDDRRKRLARQRQARRRAKLTKMCL